MFCTHSFVKIALVFGAAAYLAGAQTLPEGRGKAEFTRICSQCHAVTIVTKLRMTEDGWKSVVNDMVSRGAQGTDDEFDRVVKYLAAHFGPDSPGGASKVNVNKATDKAIASVLGLSAADAQPTPRSPFPGSAGKPISRPMSARTRSAT